MTEWHARCGGTGVIICHGERKSVCIYSKPKKCSASEEAAITEGLMRHSTDARINRIYAAIPTAPRS